MSLPLAAGPFTLVIDAGHGGHDAGAVGTVAKEKTINLNVALAFGQMVEKNCPDVKVIYTRKKDVFVTLQERANIANRAKADLFISIHTNAVASNKGAVYGAETYTLGMHRAADNLEVAKRENSVITMESDYKTKYQGFDPNKAESYIIFEFMQDKNMAKSVKLAKAIQQQYSSCGRKNKGVHQAGFLVLRETSMPSVLTELGFISNPSEESFLNSTEGVNKLAKSIYDGFCSYRRQNTAEVAAPEDKEVPLLASNASSEVSTASAESQVASAKSQVASAERQVTSAKSQVASAERPVQSPAPSVRPVKSTPYPRSKAKVSQPDDQKTQQQAEKPQTAVVKPQVVENVSRPAPEKPQAVEEKSRPTPVKSPSTVAPESCDDQPVFKIQLFTSDRQLRPGDARLKGFAPEFYKDGAMYKYTHGNTTDYNEILRLKKSVAEKFSGIFIIAFINGKRTDLQQAIAQAKKK